MLLNEALYMDRLLHQQTPGLAPKQHCLKREKWPKNCLRKQRGEMREVGEDLPFEGAPHSHHESTQHPEQALGNEILSFHHMKAHFLETKSTATRLSLIGKGREGMSPGRQ